jgi:SSS family solute:Na+ symporter
VLTALVPGSMILMAAATLLAHNLYRLLRRSADDAEISRLARLMVPVVALVAVAFTLEGGATIVALLLMAYSFVTQLFPALVCSLMRYNFATKEGAIAGILAGVATVATVTLTQTTLGKLVPSLPQAVQDLNIGLVALIVNVVVLIIVSRVAQAARMMAQPQMRPSP